MRSVESGVPKYLDLWFFRGDVWIVASADFYPENQHQLLDLHRDGLFALPCLIDIEDFSYESRSQPDVFQTQDYLISTSGKNLDGSASSNYSRPAYERI